MVTERKQLRTYGIAYMQQMRTDPPEVLAEQRRSIERWIALHAVKVLDWYTDLTAHRKELRVMLDRLIREWAKVDYVLVDAPTRLGKTPANIRTVKEHCEACGARVIYTSR